MQGHFLGAKECFLRAQKHFLCEIEIYLDDRECFMGAMQTRKKTFMCEL